MLFDAKMQKKEDSGQGKTATEVELEFTELATSTLLLLKKRSGMSFGKIAKALETLDLGVETPGQLKAKFRRGKFSHVFFMRMLLAMNVVEARYLDVLEWERNGEPRVRNLTVTADVVRRYRR